MEILQKLMNDLCISNPDGLEDELLYEHILTKLRYWRFITLAFNNSKKVDEDV